MIEVIRFKAVHIQMMEEQEGQIYLRPYIEQDHLLSLENGDWAFTGLSNGRVVACGGVGEFFEHRGMGWAFLAQDCKKEFFEIHKIAKKILDLCPFTRVEAVVDFNFRNGHRWVRALGFQLEAERMKNYLPTGGDSSLYARIK